MDLFSKRLYEGRALHYAAGWLDSHRKRKDDAPAFSARS